FPRRSNAPDHGWRFEMSDSTNGSGLNFRIWDAWYVLCASHELRARPVARRLMNLPLVLFRDSGGTPGALLDRCAHRNAPLSAGLFMCFFQLEKKAGQLVIC
ncbi:MAG: Rieske 2Fe-2S domain-containing protein, partial [Nitrosopumilaceae archaeon]